MRFQAITQILLVGLSLVMIFAIVRPTFETVRANQDEIAKFREAISTAGMFNAKLSELRARAESFSQEDLNALETYLPAEIDPLSVSRDIVAIVEKNQMGLVSIEAGEVSGDDQMNESADPGMSMTPDGTMVDPALAGDPAADPMMPGGDPMMGGGISLADEAERMLVAQTFSLEVNGDYEQLKTLLADIERSAYPLRLMKLEIGTSSDEEGGASEGAYSLELETYALTAKEQS